MAEIKYPVRLTPEDEVNSVYFLRGADNTILARIPNGNTDTGIRLITALNESSALRERVAYLERGETMNAVFCYQLDRIREHFDDDNRIKGDGKWRIDELVKCIKAMDAAYKECVRGDDEATAALRGKETNHA